MTKSSGFDSKMDPADEDDDLEFDEDELLELEQSDVDENEDLEIDDWSDDVKDLDGSDNGSSYEKDDVNWSDEDEDLHNLDPTELSDGSMPDDEMDEWVKNEQSESTKKSKRKSKKDRMFERAATLGYQGNFFDTGDDFAAVDEFENLISDNEDFDDGQELEVEEVGKKRKSRGKSQLRKKRR